MYKFTYLLIHMNSYQYVLTHKYTHTNTLIHEWAHISLIHAHIFIHRYSLDQRLTQNGGYTYILTHIFSSIHSKKYTQTNMATHIYSPKYAHSYESTHTYTHVCSIIYAHTHSHIQLSTQIWFKHADTHNPLHIVTYEVTDAYQHIKYKT